jgi:hypothetical protein
MHDRPHCYYHSNWRARRMAMAQARARGQKWWFTLPPLEDMRAVQSAVAHIVEALAAELIEPKRAQVMLAALRLASHNFRATRAWIGGSEYENDGRYASIVRYPGLEEDYDLPGDIDLDADPRKVFPVMAASSPSAQATSQEASAPKKTQSTRASAKASQDARMASGAKKHKKQKANNSRVAKSKNEQPPKVAPARDYMDVDPQKMVAEARAMVRQAIGKLPATGTPPPGLTKKHPSSVPASPDHAAGHVAAAKSGA